MKKLIFVFIVIFGFSFNTFAQKGSVHCFALGTLVTMSDKTQKKIEEIKIGDKILSFDLNTKQTKESVVESISFSKQKNLVTFVFENGKTITSTDDHPFFTNNGWASLNPSKTVNYLGFENVAKIEFGDLFVTEKKSVKLKATSLSSKAKMTYSIVKLNNSNTFFANGFVVGVEQLK